MPSYTIDSQHSIVEFAVKHMKVSTVRGRFLGIEGTLHIDEGTPEKSWVDVRINAAAVDTGVKERDEHLRSSDFLNTNLHPRIRFHSTTVERVDSDEGRWNIHGDLTVRGITRPVVLEATLEGRLIDVDFRERIGFSAETVLNRRDFGINWNGFLGRYLVSDEVRVLIDLEAQRRSDSSQATVGADFTVTTSEPARVEQT
jgi:polyisoprenoid-binding protein YceI